MTKTLKMIVACMCSCAWVGTLITGLASYLAANEEAEAIEDENQASREEAAKLNKIRLQQYEREQRFEENKFRYQQHQDEIKKFEGILNSSAALKAHMTKIWGGGISYAD